MKRNLLVICLLLGAAFVTQAAPRQAAGIDQAVLKLEQEWVDALLKADTARLETLYADTLVYTHSSGSVDDKAKYLASIKSGATKYLSLDRDDVKVNVYGNAAVVTCHVLIKLKANGEDRTVNARMIHVYAKQKGRWQMVAHQRIHQEDSVCNVESSCVRARASRWPRPSCAGITNTPKSSRKRKRASG